MEIGEVGLVAAAGMAAGAINTLVGSGTLITFPALLAVGYAPVTANVSNSIGLVPGSASGAYGYRRELRGQGRRAARLGAASTLGGIAGAVALLALPASAFEAIVPAFVAMALVLIAFGKRLQRLIEAHRGRREPGARTVLGVGLCGIYGGYFGAAQGIMLLALLGPALPDDLQRVNALKNVLAGLVNAVSGLVFVFAAHVAWEAVVTIAAGSMAGAQLGARYGRRLDPEVLRGVVLVVGAAAVVGLVLRW